MRSTASSFFVLSLLSVAGCLGTHIRERQRISAPLIGCHPDNVEITEIGSWEWYARCDRSAYRCTIAGRTEAECFAIENGTLTAQTSGGEANPAADAPPTQAPPPDAAQTDAPRTEPAWGAGVRASLDARRDAILACVGAPPVGIAITIAAEGATQMRLTGERTGTSEEECVRHVLDDLRAEGRASQGETIIHVLR